LNGRASAPFELSRWRELLTKWQICCLITF
jgi:hypothetical protein